MTSLQCLTPNPDIAGIGVRVAIYTQAVMSLLHPLLAAADRVITPTELKSLEAMYLGILIPGCALLFSAIVQVRTFGLSAYHALIILNLSWINNTSVLTFFVLFIVFYKSFDETEVELTCQRRVDWEAKVQVLNQGWPEVRSWYTLEERDRMRSILRRAQRMAARLKTERKGFRVSDPEQKVKYDAWTKELKWFKHWRLLREDELGRADRMGMTRDAEMRRRWDIYKNGNHAVASSHTDSSGSSRHGRPSILTALSPGVWFHTGTSKAEKSNKQDGSSSNYIRVVSPMWGGGEEGMRRVAEMEMEKSVKAARERFRRGDIEAKEALPLVEADIGETLRWLRNRRALPARFWAIFCSASAHLLLISALGLWLWFNIDHFGLVTFRPCTPYTRLIVFGIPIPVTSRILRILSLTVYFLAAVPGLNVVAYIVGLIIATSTVFLFYIFLRFFVPRTPSYVIPVFATFLCQLYFIVTTELTIGINEHMLTKDESRESDWTFGQTLAVGLLIMPSLELVKFIVKQLRKLRVAKEAEWSVKSLVLSLSLRRRNRLRKSRR